MNSKSTIRSPAFIFLASAFWLSLFCSCGNQRETPALNRETARRELAALGKQFRPIDFITAAKDGDAIVVDLFLKCGMSANVTEGDLTPLMTSALFSGTPETIGLLIRHGADVNFKTSQGNTPLLGVLSRATDSASEADRKRIIEALLDAGANINVQDANGSTPLLKAIMRGSVEITKLLLMKGADTRLTAADGVSPVFLATTMQRIDLVKVLLDHGAFVGHYTSEGQHALNVAERMSKAELVSLLKRALDVQLKQHLASAEQGDVTSMYYVSRAWLMGDFGQPDRGQFFKWIERAANAGDVLAEIEVGIAYLNGVGVEKNSRRGREWLWKAAKNGSVRAGDLLHKEREAAEARFPQIADSIGRTISEEPLRAEEVYRRALQQIEAEYAPDIFVKSKKLAFQRTVFDMVGNVGNSMIQTSTSTEREGEAYKVKLKTLTQFQDTLESDMESTRREEEDQNHDWSILPKRNSAEERSPRETKEALRKRIAPYTPSLGGRQIATADRIQRLTGKPQKEQRVGDQVYWYFECSDGTVQVVLDADALFQGQALITSINEY